MEIIDKFIEDKVQRGIPREQAEKEELKFYNCYQEWVAKDRETRIEYKAKHGLDTLYEAYQHFMKECRKNEIE